MIQTAQIEKSATNNGSIILNDSRMSNSVIEQSAAINASISVTNNENSNSRIEEPASISLIDGTNNQKLPIKQSLKQRMEESFKYLENSSLGG